MQASSLHIPGFCIAIHNIFLFFPHSLLLFSFAFPYLSFTALFKAIVFVIKCFCRNLSHFEK